MQTQREIREDECVDYLDRHFTNERGTLTRTPSIWLEMVSDLMRGAMKGETAWLHSALNGACFASIQFRSGKGENWWALACRELIASVVRLKREFDKRRRLLTPARNTRAVWPEIAGDSWHFTDTLRPTQKSHKATPEFTQGNTKIHTLRLHGKIAIDLIRRARRSTTPTMTYRSWQLC